ncbi:MAG: Hsp20/alpha crystallin family protein [Gemmataceae bacterium]|nr:Hsp20/alpha crystallin family protein [Gemmataceae bacterium]
MLSVLQNSLIPVAEGPVNRLANVFDRIFNDDFFAPLTAPSTWFAAPLAIWEDEDHYWVEVDAPGMTEKDIDVSIHNGDLVIRGERKCERKSGGYDTRTYGRFEQRVSLPKGARTDQVDAKLANGVLTLSFAKGDEAKPKKITLRTE